MIPNQFASLAFQRSPSGNPDSDDWVFITPDEVPQWLKESEVIKRLLDGEMASNSSDGGEQWYRAFQVPMTIESANRFATEYLSRHAATLKSDDSKWGIESLKQEVMEIADQIWVYQVSQGREPNPDSQLTQQVTERLARLIFASSVSRTAYDALAAIAVAIQDRNQNMPELLAEWLTDVNRERRPRPRQHGPSKDAHWGRDLHIAFCVYLLERAGLKPTRNDASATRSGCDIVADVITTKIGIPLGYEGVKTVWKRYSKLD